MSYKAGLAEVLYKYILLYIYDSEHEQLSIQCNIRRDNLNYKPFNYSI